MKNLITYILAVLMLFVSLGAFSNEWNNTRHLFNYQKNLEGNLGNDSQYSASISFNGKIYNFITYTADFDQSYYEIVVREIDYMSGLQYPWSLNGNDTDAKYVILNEKSSYISMVQPTPVVFNGVLYLFVQTAKDGLAYVTFNSKGSKGETLKGKDQWSDLVTNADGNNNKFDLSVSSAVVTNGKLCIMHAYSDSKLQLSWTTDPTNHDGWQSKQFDATVGNWLNVTGQKYGISMIAKSYKNTTGNVIQKLQLGYITNKENARFAEYEFDSDGNQPTQIQNIALPSDMNFRSVALAEGSVSGDDLSQGNCTQMFLKKKDTDNGYLRYRIVRWQLKDGEWTRPEGNVLPQNKEPDGSRTEKMWADKTTNLTVVNFATLDQNSTNSRISQYMVLVFRGYDDSNHPLNVAWAKTDYLKYKGRKDQNLRDSIGQRQYIGFIEGTLPYYLNPPPPIGINHSSYTNVSDDPISEVEYENTIVESNSTSLAFESSHSITAKYGGIKAEVAFSHSLKSEFKTSLTSTSGIKIPASALDTNGWVIFQAPVISRAEYQVTDDNGNELYPYYIFSMKENYFYETYDLESGLKSSDPQSFMNRDIDFSLYNSFESQNISCVPPAEPFQSVKIEVGQSEKNTNKKTLKLSSEMGDIFGSELEKSIEYETTTETVEKNKIICTSRLNEPDPLSETDVISIDVTINWLKFTPGNANCFWFKNQANYPGQTPWCLTYDVTRIQRKYDTLVDKGSFAGSKPRVAGTETTNSTNNSPLIDQPEAGKSSLTQNFPNPTRGLTKIKYTLGGENQSSGTTTCMTRLIIYNLSGQQVATLVNENKAPGSYEVEWDASQFTPGVYFYSLQSGSFKDVKKLVLLK
jgi:hypothetical protein